MSATLREAASHDGAFASTRWTMVRNAADSQAETEAASSALSDLCRMYWPPIYGYIRRRGYAPEDAQDLTQSFFLHLIENETLRRACRDRGRFRNFLLGAVNLCLADEATRRHAVKRGGQMQFVSLEELAAEELHHQQMARYLTPDEVLDARWARVLLDRAITTLREEFVAKKDAETFAALSPFLGGEKSGVSYQTVADELGLTLGAVKTSIHRLRREFAAIVRREIMQTVSAPHEAEDELRRLRAVFVRAAERQAA